MPGPVLTKTITPEALDKLRKARWRGRTDLWWLSRHILGHKDVDRFVHGPLINTLQKFPLPDEEVRFKSDIVIPGKEISYTPWQDLYSLEGIRRRLILDSRGFLKTTLDCVSHIIQILLNYPDIAIVIFRASMDGSQDILREIKSHFQYNEVFRQLYPDYCPQKRIDDFGNQNEFFIPNRKDKFRKEPSVRASSIDKGIAGAHFDWMKFSDIVDEDNTKTDTQIRGVISSFYARENLLVRPDGWMDVEGTRYDFGDLYGVICDKWLADPSYRERWSIYARGCFLKDTGDQPPKYTPDELDLPFKLDSNGEGSKRISVWPSRFTTKWLDDQEKEDGLLFAAQRLNSPVSTDEKQVPFPLAKFRTKSRLEFERVPIAFHTTTVDTASTQHLKSNFTVITTMGWDRYGRGYAHDIRHGRFMSDEIIRILFEVNGLYRPRSIKIEEWAFVEGFKPGIMRQSDLTGIYLPIEYIRRDTDIAKKDRILGSYQPYYSRGEVFFLDDLACLEHIRKEHQRFPKFTDDILDTLADQFQNRDWFGRERERPDQTDLQRKTQQALWLAQQQNKMFDQDDPEDDHQDAHTGGDPYFNSRIGGL